MSHELQGGERSTLSFVMCCGRDTVTAEPLAWVRSPLRMAADPDRLPAGRRVGAARRRFAAAASRLRHARSIGGREDRHAFTERRETIDEYGWRQLR